MPTTRRRKSSLGADIRGDTSAPAMSTMDINKSAPLSDITEQPQVCSILPHTVKPNFLTHSRTLIGGRFYEIRQISPQASKVTFFTRSVQGCSSQTHMAYTIAYPGRPTLWVRDKSQRIESVALRALFVLPPRTEISWRTCDVRQRKERFCIRCFLHCRPLIHT